MGGEAIRTSVMRFVVKVCIEETLWTGGEGILYVMIGIGTGAMNFSTGGSFFAVTSFVSSGSQKKVYSEDRFGSGDVREVVTFDRKAISFDSSASGFQMKESSEMSFVHGVTGDEMSFVGEMI